MLPLAVKGVRASCRAIAPDAMEWAVTADNADLKKGVYEEDKSNSEKGEEYLRQVLPLFLNAENPADTESFLAMLRKPITMGMPEMAKLVVYSTRGVEGLKSVYPEMNEEDVELFARKALAHQVQETAKFMVFVEQPVNDWAREIFNSDGTLKSEEAAAKKLKDRWPPPPAQPAPPSPKGATLDSHQLELSQSLSKYG